MDKSIAIICPNVKNETNQMKWIEKPFPEKLNSWPEWTRIINAHAVYGDKITYHDELKLKYHHDIVMIIANPIKSEEIKRLIETIRKICQSKKIRTSFC